MSFSASLTFKNQTNDDKNPIVVLSCSYTFFKNVNATGQPNSTVRGGTILLTVIGSKNLDFIAWVCSDSKKGQDGTITFYQADSPDQEQRKIEFKGAYCVKYTEEFTNSGTNPVIETIVLTANTISIGSHAVNNHWLEK